MPLQSVLYHLTAYNSLLETSMTFTYVNDTESKIEALLEMPNSPDIVISKLKITFGDTTVTGIIKEKERAHEMYEDAISRG